ncbi:hypothetical protein [Halomonas organivorans]|uniref:Putative Zn-binding protein involved in type VI secretion n=1 Tax=Halomonas organivorans TaxID=257772 RepID=A0A7W5G6V0_9GAMM|nr:hypothetical protein [Halomonas organivorans]MBB3142579.1 putative Zn-binding protein involved in type VI secretion [Halomonas organivorans]
MGRKFVWLGDLGTDHEGIPPTPVMAGSPTTMVDGKPMVLTGHAVNGGGVVIGSASGEGS